MAELNIEIGRLMAQVDALQKQLADIKKDISQTKKQMDSVHTELLNFMGTVQSKAICQVMQDKIRKDFVLRAELAPLKAITGAVTLATVTAIVAAVFNLILK